MAAPRRCSQSLWRAITYFSASGSAPVRWLGPALPGVFDVPCLCRRILLWKPINIDDHAAAEAEVVRGSGNVSLPSRNKNGGPVRFLRRAGFCSLNSNRDA